MRSITNDEFFRFIIYALHLMIDGDGASTLLQARKLLIDFVSRELGRMYAIAAMKTRHPLSCLDL